MTGEPPGPGPAEVSLRAGHWDRAREEFRRRLAARPEGPAYEGLADALWWLDDGTGCLEAREAAYRLYRDGGDDVGAARAALSLAYDSFLFGAGEGVARGWWGLAQELLTGVPERAEHGWLAVREAELALATHTDPAVAQAAGDRAEAIGRRLDDRDLTYVGMALGGLAQTTGGSPGSGVPRMDYAVADATSGEVADLMWMGKICCWVIIACRATLDLTRADDWCQRVETICRRQHLDPLFTVCRIQHSAVLIERGTWSRAENALAAVLDRDSSSRRHSRLDAVVQLGELRRRQGRFEEAEELLGQAEFDASAAVSRALIQLARGEAGTAWSSVRAVLRATPPSDRLLRARLLLPAVLTASAAGDLEAAESAAAELQSTAALVASPPMSALAAAAAATLAPPAEASALWLVAVRRFHEAGLPFDEAESRLRLAATLLLAGDTEDAQEQTDAATSILTDLGALAGVEEAARLHREIRAPGSSHGLTQRETEVLRGIADGMTNQQIADTLVLSPHTVHRHVAHILAKLQQPSRAAAVAHAMTRKML